MKNEKKMNNKGFSLVELIIVIAIMAVLIAVLAPQYMGPGDPICNRTQYQGKRKREAPPAGGGDPSG